MTWSRQQRAKNRAAPPGPPPVEQMVCPRCARTRGTSHADGCASVITFTDSPNYTRGYMAGWDAAQAHYVGLAARAHEIARTRLVGALRREAERVRNAFPPEPQLDVIFEHAATWIERRL